MSLSRDKDFYWWRDKAAFWPTNGSTPTHMHIPRDWSYEYWCIQMRKLQAINYAWQFYVGDMMLYGEDRWGEDIYQIIEDDTRTRETIRKAMWVCSKIPPEMRRQSLTFSLHAEVAGHDKDLTQDDRRFLLDEAEKRRPSSRDMRLLVQEYIKAKSLPEDHPRAVLVSPEVEERDPLNPIIDTRPPAVEGYGLVERATPHKTVCPSCGHIFEVTSDHPTTP